MRKMSKSKMTRAEEAAYDAALGNLHKAKSQHFVPATFVTVGNRRALILGRARGILWIEYDDGGTEMITPIALEQE